MNKMMFPPSCWIWTAEPETDDGTPKMLYFRKSLTIDVAADTATVRLSADSRYHFFVNGVSISFGPCKGDDKVWYYDEVDIAPYLKPGENVLSAVVLRYSTLNKGNQSVWRTPTPGFYLNGSLTVGGETIPLQADTSWKCVKAEHIQIVPEDGFQVFLYNTERAAGDPRFSGWTAPGYDDGFWQGVKAYHPFHLATASSPGNLLPRPIPFLYKRERRFTGLMCRRQSQIEEALWNAFLQGGESITIEPNRTEIVELNAGELTTGFLKLALSGGAGAEISLLTSEAYARESATGDRMPTKGDRTDWQNGKLFGFTDSYRVSGHGSDERPEEYEPFWFRTFRFIGLKITTADEALRLLDFRYRETGYPLDAKTQVETSDASMSGIWDISLRTLRRCMHETYEDCPFYEQLQYAMDTRSQILYTYSVSADDRLARRCIDDFHRSLRYDGLTNCCCPSVGTNVIPGFSLYYIMMIHDHMMYFGDEALVERYMPTIDAILGFFERSRDERGLVGKTGNVLSSRFWSFVDWTPEWNATVGVPDAILHGPLTMESLLYAHALDLSAELASYVGRTGQGERYAAQSDALKNAINTHCIGADGLYQDGPGVDKYSQHCQIWAVLSGTAPASQWRKLVKTSLTNEKLTRCSVAMAFYLFRAVEKAGLYDRTDALWNPWRTMLQNNLTTCEEDQVNTRSDCHAWGSLALYELPAVVLGVRPAKPGYAAVSVKPNLGYFDWAKGSVITPRGEIFVDCKRTDDGLQVTVNAPEGVEVER